MIKYSLVSCNQKVSLNTIKLPLYLYVELTDSCNMNCKFCSISKKSKKFIDMNLLKKILIELKNLNIFDVYYTGGEPLLHPNFEEIINFGYSLGIRQTILTNGLLINKYKHLMDKIMCVCVSLHGGENLHNKLTGSNCYSKVISNVKSILKDTNVNINCTVTSENQEIGNLKQVLEFGKDNNIKVSFSKYNNLGVGKVNNCNIELDKFIISLNELRKEGFEFSINDCICPCLVKDEYKYLTHGCGAGYLFGSITYDGFVKICPSSNYKVGNINDKNFEKIWNDKLLKKYRTLSWLPVSCKSCPNLSKCRGGCKVELLDDLISFNDYSVHIQKEKVWDTIKNKKVKVNIALIRKNSNNYVNLNNPPRIFNHTAFKIIEKLNNGVIPSEIPDSKDFIISLYRDKLLEVE